MNRRTLITNTLLFLGAAAFPQNLYPLSMTIIQIPQQRRRQMMGYVVVAPDKSIVIIDGGEIYNAPFLVDLVSELGGRVTHWLITHPHDDHVGALTRILREKSLEVATVYGALPSESWARKYGGRRVKDFLMLSEALEASSVPMQTTMAGDLIRLGGMNIEVLSTINPEITRNGINNSSVVYRFYDYHKSVLFLGDLGVEGGEKLLNSPFGKKLKSDYVQMAHHGQNGVGKSFYQKVMPRGCFWPTPLWLYENDAGGGKNSGKWKTLEVRSWMVQFGAKSHYIAHKGLQKVT